MLVSTSLERDGFLAAFSERTGGVSEGSYESLNLSFAVGDDDTAVAANRQRAVAALRVERFATAEQVHGARMVRVGAKRAGAGFAGLDDRIPGADAMVTTSASVALAVLTADCVPLVAACAAEGRVAIVHAGWRGLASGIVGEVVSLFGRPGDVRVALGPAIGPDHYEVGEDVVLAVAAGTQAGAVTDRRGGTTRLDLVGTIRAELRALGIRHVDDTGLCTACETSRFFSFRRDETTGRQAGVAVKLSA